MQATKKANKTTILHKQPTPHQTKESLHNKSGRGAQASERNPVVTQQEQTMTKTTNPERKGQNHDMKNNSKRKIW